MTYLLSLTDGYDGYLPLAVSDSISKLIQHAEEHYENSSTNVVHFDPLHWDVSNDEATGFSPYLDPDYYEVSEIIRV